MTVRAPTLPSRTLLQGKPYTSAAATDIRATFERLRAEAAKRNPPRLRRA